jgi:hypothetical protein
MTFNNIKTRLSKYSPDKALIIFLVVSMFILTLSLACGPDPRVKIYILASEKTANNLSMSIRDNVKGELVFYTPREEFNDLDILVRTKTIRMILVADCPFVWKHYGKFQLFLKTVIAEVDRVIVVQSYERYRVPSKIIAYIPNEVSILSERDICSEISSIMRSSNRNYSSYEFFLKLIALCSLAIVGIGAVFCSFRILDSRSSTLFRRILESTLVGGVVFIVIQQIYLISSTIIETPITLHTTYARITAISLIGPFGGGTIPRFLGAVLGAFLGIIMASRRNKLEISIFTIIYSIFGMALLLTEGIRLFGIIGNLPATILYFYGYAFYMPFVETGKATVFEVIHSRGVMMMFPGFILLGVSPKMRSRLRSLTISFSILASSWGLMRVGDMRFSVALRSFLPGIVLGVLIAITVLKMDEIIANNRLVPFLKQSQNREYDYSSE